MYGPGQGRSRPRLPSGDGWRMPTPSQPPPRLPPPDNFLYQNPNNPYLQNLNSPFFVPNPTNYLPYNPYFQNPDLSAQNTNYFPQRQSNFKNSYNRKEDTSQSNVIRNNTTNGLKKNKLSIEMVDRVATKAHNEILETGENVSAWKVSQAVLLELKLDSWSDIGFAMQEIPTLYRLILTEGKVNAFIHCFVAVRRITSLYELEVGICKNEGVQKFDELEVGPLRRHPLVLHYFSMSSDVSEVVRITSEEIVSCLCEFLDSHQGSLIQPEDVLDFIAKKRSVISREKLGVRIQSLGMHISFIREARRSEDSILKKYLKKSVPNTDKKNRKRPLFSLEKKKLDERFDSITQRITSFSSSNERFLGKHIRFVSSSSDAECDDPESGEEYSDDSQRKFLQDSTRSSDRVSSCPYPSLTEEKTRLGLTGETNVFDSPGRCNESGPSKKKRKRGKSSGSAHSLPVSSKRKEKYAYDSANNKYLQNFQKTRDKFSLDYNAVMDFVTTWKEECHHQTVAKVSQSMMKHYDMTPQGRLCPQERKQRRLLFKTYPFIGLLNVAVHSIKCGMWDSIYDTFQAIGEHNCSQPITDTSSKFESIDVEPSVKTPAAISRCITEGKQSITVEDIAKKITAYFRTNHENSRTGKSPLQKQLKFLKNMSSCEAWLAEKFSVKEFKMLGQGDFCSFLENHGSLLPSELLNHLIGDIFEKASLEVEMLQNQLVFLVAQASNNSWEGKIDQQKISSLLMRQFPSILLNIRENVSLETFFNMVKEQQDTVVSSCVVFSSTLFGTKDYLIHNGDSLVDTSVARTGINQNVRVSDNAASKGAIDVLLRAPMLLDLHMWLHWDLVYSPSLGPLVQWLINEVNTKELLCMVMKDGSIIRINPSATKDSFFEALLHGSPFHAAVELLSLFASFGGKEHAPLSLLKSHARQAFEVMLKNSTENMEAEGSEFLPVHVKNTLNMQTVNSDLGTKLNLAVLKNLSQENRAALVPSRFILDCLICLPSEFRSLAADVLLSGLQGLLKEITSAVLIECEKIEHRLMLHEIGLSLGINEWIEDYNVFSRSNADFLSSSHLLHSKAIRGVGFGESSVGGKQKLPQIHSKNDKDISHKESTDTERSAAGYHTEIAEVSSYGIEEGNTQNCSQAKDSKDAALLIESIRREEFGLDSNMSNLESSMLKKQHARLGRALQCLSQELYSQDSHFLLELVQNADDNIYPENVEPTLTFILEEAGIVVLNNEQGFSAHNIRALCDVGNSTKKGCGSGYIGQKGIGFKSVFRVSDSPEIHSNGFHVKFDISQGQIGFVLPTIVPPCDIKKFTKLASADTDPIGDNSWNTCIVLPFKLNATGGVSNTIKSMFSDLHPSLLLFLHRLRCIKFRNMLNDSLIVMRKEIVGNGIIKVSHGNDNMTWLVVSQKLQANAIRPDVQTTEISLAFTLKESDKGDYIPDLNLQPVFAFLPLRTYGLKFILQGDFILPSSREAVDGDSSWNQWLLSEYPGLFVDSERSFCALPCFADNPGKAVTAYMSFVPLVGEVHGFFSSLSRMITSRLRLSNCLLQEGDKTTWVPPCKVLRNWNAKARSLLPDDLLSDYLGIGLLDKDIILSDSLSNSLGIEEYGPRILLQIISSLCDAETGLASVGLCWLCSWLNEFYNFVFHSSGKIPLVYGTELELISKLRRIPFIPLSDGTYVSMEQGTIWLQSDVSGHSLENELSIEGFRNLNTQLRTVSHGLLSAAAADGMTSVENITRLLHKIGVQQLSAHEIVKIQILPAISDDRITSMDKMLMAEYLLFVMLHLQSSCSDCRLEREFIISELQNKAFILTNNGYKRPHDVSIHLGKEYGNPIDIKRLIHDIDFEWNEVNIIYLKHPTSASLCNAQSKWREFFLELGVTDFVQIAQVRKSLADVSQTLLKSILGGGESISLASVVTDWESDELVRLLSLLSKNGNRDKCKYMLEILDLLWDNFFSEKVTGCCSTDSNVDDKPFKSSFMSSICDVQWIASSMDDTLHYSKDLFHDCDAVSLILGASAPYSVPKVGSSKLLSQIGFKTQVTIDDVLSLLHVWRKSTIPFKASIAQMSRFYSFIWKELASSRHRIVVEFCSGPFIFVPLASAPRHEDIVPGVFLSSEEVYWHDSTGCLEQIKTVSPEFYSKTLDKIYPGLYDFFVKECRVHEDPPALQYLQILLQLAGVALPSQAANAVFQVLVKWAEGLKSGMISSEEIVHLKERLFKLEFAVLPTIQDKWVSLHPSFGVVCWCDDEKLKEEFKHLNNLDFLYFGKISANGQESLEENVLSFLRTLGIPVLSELVTREAIHYGLTDNNFKTSLFNLALPYAQRYIHYLHPDKYSLFKQSIFEKLNFLQIVVVEKLYSRNAIKKCDGVSVKRHECDTLLQGNILYATRDSEPHPLFMELSRLFFDGIPELHLANFLHMLTTLVESGSSEKQIELILNRQKLSKLPHEEQIWSLSNLLPLGENNKTLEESYREANNKEISRKPGISSSWPSADWKTAPCFSYPHANDFHTQAAQPWQSNSSFWKSEGSHEHVVTKLDPTSVIETDVEWTVEDEVAVTSGLTNSTVPDVQAYQNFYQVDTHPGFDPEDTNAVLGGRTGTSSFSQRPQLNTGNPSTSQAMLTGRLGEQVACKYFKGKDGEAVTWVNEDSETGLPYDIVIGEDEDSRQYIEVKATKSARKDWFNITLREWQFASEKANAFSIAHVLLSDNNTARITVFKNPIKLCQSGKLQLVVMMPKQQQDLVLIS